MAKPVKPAKHTAKAGGEAQAGKSPAKATNADVAISGFPNAASGAKTDGKGGAETRKTLYGPVSVLNHRQHGGVALSPAKDHRFAAHINSIMLAATEFPHAALHYPIVFSESEGIWSAFAITGPSEGRNVFVGADGKWLEGAYVPALVRRYPFLLVEDQGRKNLSLAADLSSDMFKGKGGVKLYEDGKPSDTARNILRFCVSYSNQIKTSQELFKRIADAGILVSRQADVTLPDKSKSRIVGFRVVDEAKLASLDDETFVSLRRDGVLNLVYCQLWSMRSWKNILA